MKEDRNYNSAINTSNMADWVADDTCVQQNGHSRHSSASSGRSGGGSDGMSRRKVTSGRADDSSDRTSLGSGISASSSDKGILLAGGNQLTEESITENRKG